MTCHLIWGCDPSLQFEQPWILYLLNSLSIKQSFWFSDNHARPTLLANQKVILVESGLLRLVRNIHPSALQLSDSARKSRISYLKDNLSLVIHVSDEEGLDAETWYNQLPNGLKLFRNFYHQRFYSYCFDIFSFPIGPRDAFIEVLNHPNISMASKRKYPWTFMGTLWPTGSRKLAASLFLYNLPTGFYHSASSFSQGMPLHEYKEIMLNSVFALCPEGDRHLDTFRLWEACSAGTIPLIVDHNSKAKNLVDSDFPIPIFSTWRDALNYSTARLQNPKLLNQIQKELIFWWKKSIVNYQKKLSSSL